MLCSLNFLGILLGIIIYKVCLDRKPLADNSLSIGQHSDVCIQHDYETIEPLFTQWLPLTEDETGVIKDLNSPTGDPEHIYYELDEDKNYTFNKMACNCDSACVNLEKWGVLNAVKPDLEMLQIAKIWRFLRFVKFLELLDNYFDKPWFLNKPNKSLNLEHCLDVARIQKI